jgi:hypothetical protein
MEVGLWQAKSLAELPVLWRVFGIHISFKVWMLGIKEFFIPFGVCGALDEFGADKILRPPSAVFPPEKTENKRGISYF